MKAVITKKQKNTIMILGAIAGFFGAAAGSVGLYLRTELTTRDHWEEQWIPEFTNGYMGVMSGFLLFLLGTVGCSLVYTRMFCLVLLYTCLSLSCDALCVLDVLLIMPYTKDYGKYAWEEPPSCNKTAISLDIYNMTTTPYPFSTSEERCPDLQLIAVLLICITVAVLLAFIFSIVTTISTTASLCRARALSESPSQPSLPLSPFTAEDLFTATNYSNILYGHNDGYKP